MRALRTWGAFEPGFFPENEATRGATAVRGAIAANLAAAKIEVAALIQSSRIVNEVNQQIGS